VICFDNFDSGQQDNVNHHVGREDFQLMEADARDPPGLPVVNEN
jgi:hypothetical protein